MSGSRVVEWTDGIVIEDQARQQIQNTASMPFVFKHVAVMPDAHWGMGSTVGTVLPTVEAIIPAAVGVDIGCGMVAQRTTLRADQLPDSLASIRSDIEAAIPHGRTDNGGTNDRGAWGEPPKDAESMWGEMAGEFNEIVEKNPRIGQWGRPERHIGTLGTGNHFIEVCLDEEDFVWVMLHSGSRGIGNRIGTHFINLAKKEMERWHISLPDKNLAYLPDGSEHFKDYVQAVWWAQRYALASRSLMLSSVLAVLERSFTFELSESAVNCHHNYVARENHFGRNVWVTRKGAVRARKGDLGIIPGSMGTRSYIVEGLGNKASFHSCSHGAGRAMSRRAARERFTLEDHARATEGVECRKDEGVLDETPGAYKSIDAVMEAQKDLVKPLHTLHAVVCVKG